MFNIFRYSYLKARGQILGWGLSLGLLGLYMVSFYPTLLEMKDQMEAILSAYPEEIFAFFGGMTEFLTPAGFLNAEFFSYMPLIIGIYMVLVGSGLLVGDEESGVLDLLLAHPISRSGLFWGRVLAFMASAVSILLIAYLGFLVTLEDSGLGLTALEILYPFISLLAFLFLFGGISLALSFLLPSRRMTAMVSGLILVASFFLTALARLDENLEQIAKISPMNYYQGGLAVEGLDWGWVFGLLVGAVIFTLLAWRRFLARDVRVGGEGGWGVPGLRFARRKPAAA